MTASEASLQLGNDIVFRRGAGHAVDFLTVFDEDERGDILHSVTGGKGAGFVHIDFTNLGHACHLGGDLINDGGNHAAGATPSCPEVNQHRYGGVDNLCLEVAFSNL